MSLILFVGPMWSGKTTKLILEMRKRFVAGDKCVMIKYSADDRYSDGDEVVSHDKYSHKAVKATKLCEVKIDKYDCIGVDEGQFFEDIILANKWANLGKLVLIAGLNGDYKQTSFGDFYKLFSFADRIKHLHSICNICGNTARFTKKLPGRVIENDKEDKKIIVDIGGKDKYLASCRKCLNI